MRNLRVIGIGLAILSFGLLAPESAHAIWIYGGGPYYAPPRYAPDFWAPQGAALGPWKWNFEFGGGPTSVVGTSNNQLSGGWNFNVGGGYNFTPRIGWVFEFMQSGLGVTDAEIQSHGANDGDANVWGLTLNPIWRYRVGGVMGGYLIGGGGFYQREMRFFQPGEIFVPTFGGGGFFVPGTIEDREFDNTGGVNVGAGFTFNVGAGTKFFVEARYHYIFTAGTPTQIIPVTFGFRW